MNRDTDLDKELPKSGYFWVPASMSNSMANMRVSQSPADKSKPLGITKKVVANRTLATFRTPAHTLKVATDVRFFPNEDSYNLGSYFLRSAKFALYGANDATLSKKAKWRDDIRSNAYVIQDSGGFQIATGVEDFLDPIDVAKAHSLYADSGVSLDIPTFKTRDKELLLTTARVLVANSKVLRENAHKNVQLLNVSHGVTLDFRLAYLKEIGKGIPLESICVGGLRQNATSDKGNYITPERFAAHVLLVMLYTDKMYEHYHVLGVASDWQMAIMALVARVHGKVVTSDSASHNLSGLAGILINYGSRDKPAYRIGMEEDEWSTARCSCKVCSYAKYEVVHRKIATLSSLHNGLSLVDKARTMRSLVSGYEKITANQLAHLLYANTASVGTALHMKSSFYKAVQLVLKTKSYKELAAVKEHSTAGSSLFERHHNQGGEIVRAAVKRYETYHKKSFS